MFFWHDVGFQCAKVSAQKSTIKCLKSTAFPSKEAHCLGSIISEKTRTTTPGIRQAVSAALPFASYVKPRLLLCFPPSSSCCPEDRHRERQGRCRHELRSCRGHYRPQQQPACARRRSSFFHLLSPSLVISLLSLHISCSVLLCLFALVPSTPLLWTDLSSLCRTSWRNGWGANPIRTYTCVCLAATFCAMCNEANLCYLNGAYKCTKTETRHSRNTYQWHVSAHMYLKSYVILCCTCSKNVFGQNQVMVFLISMSLKLIDIISSNVHQIACRTKNPDIPRTGRGGAAHGGVAGRCGVGRDADGTVRPEDKPSLLPFEAS